jgi:adenosyl cobinamide kinase/adenosyl cobinamide phosphate guanylyltransferase
MGETVDHLTVLLGGARAGKTTFAEHLARAAGDDVTYIATCPHIEGDTELSDRIQRHRADRPAGWTTVEEEIDLARAVTDSTGLVVIDCLTTWVGNLLHHGHDEAGALTASDLAVEAVLGRAEPTVVVSNEVGLGVVPATELGREYRDVLGRVNQRWVAASDRALLIVAGRALRLDSAEDLG